MSYITQELSAFRPAQILVLTPRLLLKMHLASQTKKKALCYVCYLTENVYVMFVALT